MASMFEGIQLPAAFDVSPFYPVFVQLLSWFAFAMGPWRISKSLLLSSTLYSSLVTDF